MPIDAATYADRTKRKLSLLSTANLQVLCARHQLKPRSQARSELIVALVHRRRRAVGLHPLVVQAVLDEEGGPGAGALAAVALLLLALRARFRMFRQGALRARSHCRVAPPLTHLIPDLLAYSAPLFLKRPCDRTQASWPGYGPRWQSRRRARPRPRPG